MINYESDEPGEGPAPSQRQDQTSRVWKHKYGHLSCYWTGGIVNYKMVGILKKILYCRAPVSSYIAAMMTNLSLVLVNGWNFPTYQDISMSTSQLMMTREDSHKLHTSKLCHQTWIRNIPFLQHSNWIWYSYFEIIRKIFFF